MMDRDIRRLLILSCCGFLVIGLMTFAAIEFNNKVNQMYKDNCIRNNLSYDGNLRCFKIKGNEIIYYNFVDCWSWEQCDTYIEVTELFP